MLISFSKWMSHKWTFGTEFPNQIWRRVLADGSVNFLWHAINSSFALRSDAELMFCTNWHGTITFEIIEPPTIYTPNFFDNLDKIRQVFPSFIDLTTTFRVTESVKCGKVKHLWVMQSFAAGIYWLLLKPTLSNSTAHSVGFFGIENWIRRDS